MPGPWSMNEIRMFSPLLIQYDNDWRARRIFDGVGEQVFKDLREPHAIPLMEGAGRNPCSHRDPYSGHGSA